MNRPMTAQEKAQARARYKAEPGLSYRQLAQEYGVSESVMLRALRGVVRPRGGVVRAQLSTEKMMQMYADGLTMSEIARQAGITQSAVSRRLAGITRDRNREAV